MPAGRHRRQQRDRAKISRRAQKITGQCAACLAQPAAHHYGVKVRRCRCGCSNVEKPE